VETLLLETSVSTERSSEVSDPHEDHVPSSIRTEHALDALDEFLDSVADTALANGPQAGDIAADLGVV
jgi:hypothetical protein